MFGGAKDICPNFPKKLAQKDFVWLLPKNFLSQTSWRCFFGVTSKQKVYMYFSANFGRNVLKINNVRRQFAQIFRDFAGIFNKSKLLVVRLYASQPCLVPPTPLYWHNLRTCTAYSSVPKGGSWSSSLIERIMCNADI